MIAYRYDDKFMYVGVQPCQRDPIASAKAGKEIYLLPAQCTYEAPHRSLRRIPSISDIRIPPDRKSVV